MTVLGPLKNHEIFRLLIFVFWSLKQNLNDYDWCILYVTCVPGFELVVVQSLLRVNSYQLHKLVSHETLIRYMMLFTASMYKYLQN